MDLFSSIGKIAGGLGNPLAAGQLLDIGGGVEDPFSGLGNPLAAGQLLGFGGSLEDLFKGATKSKQSQTGTSDTTTTGKTASQQAQETINRLAQATPFQNVAESQLLGALQGYNPYQGQQALAGQTTGLMQQLLQGGGLNATPQQQALLQGQTQNYMTGLMDYLNDWQQGAMSQAQQSALARGIPLSDIARGQEANVQSQYGRQLAQGYNQAMQNQMQNELNLPMQNLQLMAGLQNQYNAPLMQQLYQIAMSRLAGPRDVTQTGTTTGTTSGTQTGRTTGTAVNQPSFLDTASGLLNLGGKVGGLLGGF